MSVDKIAPQSTQHANMVDSSDAPSAKNNVVALIDSNVANGLMSEKDAEFLKAGIEGRSKNFSSSNGFLNSLIELLEFAATTKSEVNLTRFEIIDNERIAKIDAAQESLDGARMGFIVTVAGASASLAAGAAAGYATKKEKGGEPDTSMTGVVINLSSQISQSSATWATQSYEFKAAASRADADQYGALGRSDVLNSDMENMIRQAIAASAN